MIRLKNITKTFSGSKQAVEALRGINLSIEQGDIFGIIGLSGAGKSTLVRCINLLERPTVGQVLFEGVDLAALPQKPLLEKRRSMSMIFQGFHLLEQRSVLKNICYPMEIAGTVKKIRLKKAEELLRLVGLSDKRDSYPSELSGGQKQRVAIARALATDPRVLLCDEATSALDPNTTAQILDLLQEINRSLNVTVVIVTHEMAVVEKICNKVAVMENGQIAEQGPVESVFLSPRSKIGRELILPKTSGAALPVPGHLRGGACIRLVFQGQSAFEPVIANLALKCGMAVTILSANTRSIDGKTTGQMILQLPPNANSEQTVKTYLQNQKIHFQEVEPYA